LEGGEAQGIRRTGLPNTVFCSTTGALVITKTAAIIKLHVTIGNPFTTMRFVAAYGGGHIMTRLAKWKAWRTRARKWRTIAISGLASSKVLEVAWLTGHVCCGFVCDIRVYLGQCRAVSL